MKLITTLAVVALMSLSSASMIAPSPALSVNGMNEEEALFTPGENGDNSWDCLVLVTQWPPAFNPKKHWEELPDRFSIHGLWPTRDDTTYPVDCDKSLKFDPSLVEDLRDEIDLWWTDWKRGPGSKSWSFYKHEWEKHGTCSVDDPLLADQRAYFVQTLDMRQQMSYMDVLANAGITPDNGRWLEYDEVSAAFENHYGYHPLLSCVNKPLSAEDAAQGKTTRLFSEVGFCYDADLNMIQCSDEILAKDLRRPCAQGSFLYYTGQ